MSVCSICGLPKCFPDAIHKAAIENAYGTPVKHKPKEET